MWWLLPRVWDLRESTPRSGWGCVSRGVLRGEQVVSNQKTVKNNEREDDAIRIKHIHILTQDV